MHMGKPIGYSLRTPLPRDYFSQYLEDFTHIDPKIDSHLSHNEDKSE